MLQHASTLVLTIAQDKGEVMVLNPKVPGLSFTQHLMSHNVGVSKKSEESVEELATPFARKRIEKINSITTSLRFAINLTIINTCDFHQKLATKAAEFGN